jgi:hypothetical protein
VSVGEIVAAHGFGVARQPVRQVGDLARHLSPPIRVVAYSAMRISGWRAVAGDVLGIFSAIGFQFAADILSDQFHRWLHKVAVLFWARADLAVRT